MIVAFTMALLSACGGGVSGGYNQEKCEALKQKIENNQEMTEADYNVMIDQLGDLVKYLDKKNKEMGDDKEKAKEFGESAEAKQMLEYTLGFAMYLEQHKNDLSSSNLKKMVDLQEEMKKLK